MEKVNTEDVKRSESGYIRFLIEQGTSQIALRRFSIWDSEGRRSTSRSVRKDIDFHNYIATIAGHPALDYLIMLTILVNALFMALETDYGLRYRFFIFFVTADELFLAIYSTELIMKVYVHPVLYWKNGYNVFDAVILVIMFIPLFSIAKEGRLSAHMHIIKACGSLRVLRTVSFIRGLQALIQALFKTMRSVVYVLGLMFLLMFLFAIIGFYYFGDPITGDPANWGDLGTALFTLFSLVTVDGWTDLQQNLDQLGIPSSRIFTIVFILIGYFIFFNMFIGVVIIEIHHATKHYESEVQLEREQSLSLKKQAIIQRQNEEIRKLVQSQTGNDRNFSKLVEQFKKSLRHSDFMVTEDLCTSMQFVDIYLTTLDHNDNTLEKLQNLYSEVTMILGELFESDILEEQEKKAKDKKLKNWRK